ncbi:hypothetical protein [Pseudomonas sp. PSKL.D1]|uniref:hypothetical protein n=1 Tax=Pseudomonas sp. PSKL.D1 TaxID=3029060 RepID=UPI002380F62B|nr:hypothetical protein [Pseudomonas sp. PSKL.D1]WDY55718.1 hypothetical protein PVV54_13955 [Pseudomonas sp. PSKL.D1]
MTTSETVRDWIENYSFIGKIYQSVEHQKIPVSLDAQNRLRASPDTDALELIFLYHSSTPGRLNFLLRRLHQRHETIDISPNNVLTAYPDRAHTGFFKLQPLAWRARSLRCLWRDQHGNPIKRALQTAADLAKPSLLTIGQGQECEYLVEQIN